MLFSRPRTNYARVVIINNQSLILPLSKVVDCSDSGGGVGHRVVVDPVSCQFEFGILDRGDARVDVRSCKEG